LSNRDVDGLGVAAFGLAPDHAIDLAWHLGLNVKWLMDDANGGACMNMLAHAVRAIEAGEAEVIALLAGDRLVSEQFVDLTDNYNAVTRDYLTPLPIGGPPTVFSFVTQRHMAKHGLTRETYGHVVASQRAWAAGNPLACYRDPLTIEAYLDAPMVADPICLFDCPPVAAGADAVVVARAERAPQSKRVHVRSIACSFNYDDHLGDGLATGLSLIAPQVFNESGFGPPDMDLFSIYDDFPVMVLVQLQDLGLIDDGDVARFAVERLATHDIAVNTSGGMLTVGQAGPSGGLHGLVECVRQLRAERDLGQVAGARVALVAGYGMVLYRYAACSVAAVLEAA
jgi:acetyl-CoA acetyltransferase